ncbi:hypothetical protein [Flavobacterium sp.]|jgi:hypothetical protein|uniref:hypothetical protein n=1 Tax=Flavobacterium sp. TaxID=239 RepID=UPI0022C55DDD|nr:hypothetical protein [Flavobacterium sp.]MCZ8091099.1 hypothetical protein [Flavobacterium sp.]
MEVHHSKTFKNKPNYLIEWGNGTWSQDWEEKDFAIRNRYNKEDGGFNVRGSAEIPWSDFNRMIKVSIEENQFSNKELKTIIKLAIKQLIKKIFKR